MTCGKGRKQSLQSGDSCFGPWNKQDKAAICGTELILLAWLVPQYRDSCRPGTDLNKLMLCPFFFLRQVDRALKGTPLVTQVHW